MNVLPPIETCQCRAFSCSCLALMESSRLWNRVWLFILVLVWTLLSRSCSSSFSLESAWVHRHWSPGVDVLVVETVVLLPDTWSFARVSRVETPKLEDNSLSCHAISGAGACILVAAVKSPSSPPLSWPGLIEYDKGGGSGASWISPADSLSWIWFSATLALLEASQVTCEYLVDGGHCCECGWWEVDLRKSVAWTFSVFFFSRAVRDPILKVGMLRTQYRYLSSTDGY